MKDFTFFTKDTLFVILGESFKTNRNISKEQISFESGLYEVFHIIKLLNKYYSLDASTNTSYEAIIFKKMRDLRHLLPVSSSFDIGLHTKSIDTFGEQHDTTKA